MINELGIIDRYRRENQYVFINSGQVPGIQSVGFENDFKSFPINFIGLNYVNLAPNEAQEGRCRIDRLIIDGVDHFSQFTGHSGFNLYVLKDRLSPTDNYGFTSGYIVNYNTICLLGQIPRTEVGIVSFGNFGRIPSGESKDTSGQFINIQSNTETRRPTVPGAGSISLSLNNDFIVNRLLSYNIDININRRPIYPLGDRYPVAVEIVYPIDINANFTFDLANYSGYSVRDFPGNPKTGHLILQVKDFSDDSIIQAFRFSGMTLVYDSYTTDIDGNVIINASYRRLNTR